MSRRPELGEIKKRSGVAGQVAYSVEVTHDGEPTKTVTFVGSVYGGPVVMVTPSGNQVLVSNAERHGPTLCPDWVRSFFAERD